MSALAMGLGVSLLTGLVAWAFLLRRVVFAPLESETLQ